MTSENRMAAEGWLEAFRRRDLSLLKLSEDFVHTSPFGEIRGRDAYLDLVERNANAFFQNSLTTVDVLDCGDRVAIRYLVNGTAACDCIYLKDGQIKEIHSYYHFGKKPSIGSA